MMNGKVSPPSESPQQHAALNRQQTLLVRVVVGSLVLCAALGTPAASAPFHGSDAPCDAARAGDELRFIKSAQSGENYKAFVAIGRAERHSHTGVKILNNMAFNANGKQLSMRLEMSREQAGNLLRQHLSIP